MRRRPPARHPPSLGRPGATATLPRRGAGSWSEQAAPPRAAAREAASAISQFRLGEDVIHAAFGDGVVTGVEPGGVIVVRFAEDGSERKLMAEYAPVTRR